MIGLVRFLSVRWVRGGAVQPVEFCRNVVEFIGVEIAADVCGGSWCEVPHRFPARSEAQRRKPGPGVCVARVELSRAPVELSPRARVRVIPHRGERPRSRSQSLRCREGVVGVGAIRKPRVFDRLSGGFVRSDMFRCVGMGKQIRVVHAVSLRMKRSADTHCGRTDDDRIARWSHLSCVDDSR